MILAESRIETAVLPDLGAVIQCEMADPVSYLPDGRTVDSFSPCGAPAEWRLVLNWHHGLGLPDEHLLCDRHLGVWQIFRAVENPAWDITILARL